MRDWVSEVRSRLGPLALSGPDEASVVEELAQHLEDRYTELRSRGVPEAEAHETALQELPDPTVLGNELRSTRRGLASDPVPLGAGASGAGSAWLAGALQDLRYAGRMLRRNPVFAAAALLTLGLGVGAATATFSLVEGMILRPLPYAQPDRLVRLWEGNATKDLARQQLSPVNAADYRRLSGVFDDVAAWWRPEADLADGAGDPIRVSTVETSENLFRVLGVHAAVGRTFIVTPQLFGREPEVVISDRLWRTRFGGDRAVIGRSLRLNGFPTTIVGVMPPGFAFPGETDVWQRLGWDLEQHVRGAHFMDAVGRLRPGITVSQANRELAALGERLGREHPKTNAGWSAQVVSLGADVVGVFRPGLFALFGASGLLLLIACINVANLLLGRAAARRGEIAIRGSLGASRARLVRQVLAESVLLGVLGTALGIGVAWGAVRGFLAWTPVDIPRAGDVGLHWPVLLFAAGLAFTTTLLFGLAPALLAARGALTTTMRGTGRGVGSRIGRRGRAALVSMEIALAVALLCGAGLLIRSVAALLHQPTGVAAPESAAVLDVQLPDGQYPEWQRVADFYAALLPAVRAHTGITSAGETNFLPLEPGWRIPFGIVGAPPAESDAERTAQYVSVDEGYFHALGVPVLTGRTFEPHDDAKAPGVVVVNETFARRFWPGENPVGKRIISMGRQIGPLGRRLLDDSEHQVIGVVGDVKNTSLTSKPEPALYWSARQFPFRRMYLVVRGMGTPADLAAMARAEVRRLDPGLALGEVRSLDRVLAAAIDPPRLVMLLMCAFATLALVLAAIGIYGILSFSVTQRRREIGVRLALGARPVDVLRMMMGEAIALTLAGALIGVAAAVAGGRLLASLMYGVTPADPITIIGVVTVVLIVAGMASAAPGRRAALTDPAGTLRDD